MARMVVRRRIADAIAFLFASAATERDRVTVNHDRFENAVGWSMMDRGDST